MERTNINIQAQTVEYDLVYLVDEVGISLRSVYDYDCIYNLDVNLGTYRRYDRTVTDMFECDVIWHDGDDCGVSTYIIKTVKGVKL